MIGLPRSSQTACSLEFRPPLVRPIQRGRAPFPQTGSGPMRFEVGRIDHDPLRAWSFTSQASEYPLKHAAPAPADKAIIQGLVRTILLRRILPSQSVTDHIDDPADHSPVVNPRFAVRARKM